MKYFLRDDDTSFFTKVKELDDVYNDILEFGPVGLAVIPYAVKTINQGIIGKQFQYEGKEYFIGKNRELVDYLREKISEGKFYIMLHGYNHFYEYSSDNKKYPFGIPEFVYTTNQFDKIKKGKDDLESLFNTEIKWFIPPSNAITTKTIDACDKLGLNLPLLCNLKDRFINTLFQNPHNFLINRLNIISDNNYPLQFKNHLEIKCTSYTSVSDFSSKYVSRKKNMIIATHYWELLKFPIIKEMIIKDLKFYNYKINSLNDLI